MSDSTPAKLRIIRSYALDEHDGAAGLQLTLTTGQKIEALVDVVDGLARAFAYIRYGTQVKRVADLPIFIDPEHIVAIRPTDDVPPTD